MNSNTIHTIGHHTCQKSTEVYLLTNAPFKSCRSSENDTVCYPYLGEGYYFWDNNLKSAEWWGKTHYNNSYSIIKIDLVLEGEDFLDLT